MNNISEQDSILDGITFNDLITTLQCNEPVINRGVVISTFDEILGNQLIDARLVLEKHMDFILKEAK